MRDYLYIWNDPVNQFLIASGIEFKDISNYVGSDGGLVLLQPDAGMFSCKSKYDKDTRLTYIRSQNIPKLIKNDIYSWGNFSWVDYLGASFPTLSDHEISELLFYSHMTRPMDRITIPALGNKYLCYIHDDGWLLQLYYSNWLDVATMISDIRPQLDIVEPQNGKTAFWVSGKSVDTEEISFDVDTVINRRCRKSK